MEKSSGERDEPLTPAGRLFHRPETEQIIHCVIGVKNTIDVDAVKLELSNSVMLQLPRFCSLLVKDSKGREHWRRTKVNIDDHVIVLQDPISDDQTISGEEAVNDYVADLAVSSPLSTDKPLWELHIIMSENCAVLRIHHSLGDGISLMSMFLAMCRRADDPSKPPTFGGVGGAAGNRRSWSMWRAVKMMWYTLVYVWELMMRCLWVKDKKTVVSGGAGVELWPRKLATAKFRLDHMKHVKKSIPQATINDVLFGIISYGLSKYLDLRSPQALQEGTRITGVAMVNLRPQPGLQDLSKLTTESKLRSRWGNMFGMMLLPVYYHKCGGSSDPLQYVRRAKSMIDKKKQSLEAMFSYKIGYFVMTSLGAKLAALINYRIVSNTTFTISNVVGPQEEITIVGNPITYIRVNNTSLPHAITMNMVSYAGRADMQILVAKDIIPDAAVLAKCFEDALLEMKESAEAVKNGSGRLLQT